MSSKQFSSPFSKTQLSRTCLVSGQASREMVRHKVLPQHGLHLGLEGSDGLEGNADVGLEDEEPMISDLNFFSIHTNDSGHDLAIAIVDGFWIVLIQRHENTSRKTKINCFSAAVEMRNNKNAYGN